MKKGRITTVALVAIILAVVWVMVEKFDTYTEPPKALLAIDNELLLIPAYQMNDKALFFFIKDKDSLGAVYVRKGLFGWKAGMLTWSAIDNERHYDSDYLNGTQGQDGSLLYGLIKNGDDRIVQVNEEQAKMLNLATVGQENIEEYRLEELFIWYFEGDESITEGEIKLLDKDTGEELDPVNF